MRRNARLPYAIGTRAGQLEFALPRYAGWGAWVFSAGKNSSDALLMREGKE